MNGRFNDANGDVWDVRPVFLRVIFMSGEGMRVCRLVGSAVAVVGLNRQGET